MKNKTTIAGAVLGVIGAGLLALFVAQAGGAQAEETVVALVVQEDLAPGMGVDGIRDRVAEADVPVSLAPSTRITDLEDVKGKEVVRTVGAGEILSASQFAAAGPVAGGLVVPQGYEAMTLEADPAPGVEGYVTPGSRVNVYATVAEDGAAPYTQLVLGHLDVLAVTRGNLSGESQAPAEGSSDGRIVLLLQVRPDDAPVLVHAQRHGALWFTLVNEDDPAPAPRRVQVGDFEPGQRGQAIGEARARQDEAAAQGEEQ
ncbi:MAG TPA: Flp pilus assembly protein CpaB [Egibacteraceae bacterium]|nr:Flp pilus assembly protein CpaB [Egibacteraceae bacterium]